MADNTTLNTGSGGDVLRDKDRAGVKTPIVALDLNPAGSETLMAGAMPVTGTFWQATQPVSIAAAVAVTQSGSWTVTANAGTGTFAISAASLPLPTGAATAAKQPALGTAGTASTDVLTVQGIASMTALKVDGSGVTQPVSGTVGISGSVAVTGTFWQATQPISGTVTANIGTSGSLALDATLTGGTQKTKLVDSGGTNVATVSAGGALKVDGSAVTQPVSGTFWQATQPISGTVIANPGATTSGGATPYSYISAGSANQDSQVIKASAGQTYGWQLFNTTSSARYVKVYDKATAPTSADTPVKRYLVPANGGAVIPQSSGVVFSNGIAFRITQNPADNDATAAATNDVLVNANYK